MFNTRPNTVSASRQDTDGPIARVLVLDTTADAALAALFGSLDAVFNAPGVILAPNQREALLALRLASFGY